MPDKSQHALSEDRLNHHSNLSNISNLANLSNKPGVAEDTATLSLEEWYHTYKRYALSIAYRMLGSMADAEDVVQDCFVELQQKKVNDVQNPKAYVAKMTVNRCLNLLHSARRQRETYVGEWLPEPVSGLGSFYGNGSSKRGHSASAYRSSSAIQEEAGRGSTTSPGIVHHDTARRESAAIAETAILSEGSRPAGPEESFEQKDMISYAFLVMLERLNPVERAVFVLREAFGYDYKEIAAMIGKSESNCRQLYSRSRRTLQNQQPDGHQEEEAYVVPDWSDTERRHLLERFTEAFLAYDAGALLELLGENSEFIADGGGVVQTVLRPMKGRKGVIALLTSPRILTSVREAEPSFQVLNGELHVVFRDKDQVTAVFCLAAGKDKRIHHLYLIINPHKLEQTGPSPAYLPIQSPGLEKKTANRR